MSSGRGCRYNLFFELMKGNYIRRKLKSHELRNMPQKLC